MRWCLVAGLLGIFASALAAETVATLPAPTGYVNDFAHILSPEAVASLEQYCTQLDRTAHAQIAVVTVRSLDPDKSGVAPTIQEFAVALEEKWKVGAKGTDRGLLVIISLNPRKYWIEIGYGLEGILNDAKVGDIGRDMQPYLRSGDYSQGVATAVHKLGQVIATDAGVTVDTEAQPTPGRDTRYSTGPPAVQISPVTLIVGGIVVVLVLGVLIGTGHIGILFYLLFNLLGGGGRGGRLGRGGGYWDGGGGGGGFGGGDGGGGFGGFGGGSSGGGGAGGDF